MWGEEQWVVFVLGFCLFFPCVSVCVCCFLNRIVCCFASKYLLLLYPQSTSFFSLHFLSILFCFFLWVLLSSVFLLLCFIHFFHFPFFFYFFYRFFLSFFLWVVPSLILLSFSFCLLPTLFNLFPFYNVSSSSSSSSSSVNVFHSFFFSFFFYFF